MNEKQEKVEIVGSHCSCCGKWIPGRYNETGWDLCDECANIEKPENKK